MNLTELMQSTSGINADAVQKNFDLSGRGDGLLGVKKTGGFASALRRAAAQLLGPQKDAAQVVQQFSRGGDGELHKTMLTLERADISLKFFVSLRNKCLEAYREVMHMGS